MMDDDRAAIREIFSQRLKLLRTRRRISRPALGELCGLGKDAVRRYEKAESFPSVEYALWRTSSACPRTTCWEGLTMPGNEQLVELVQAGDTNALLQLYAQASGG